MLFVVVSVGNTKEGRTLFSFGVCVLILPWLQVSCVELGDSDNDRDSDRDSDKRYFLLMMLLVMLVNWLAMPKLWVRKQGDGGL
jgi:hypothetical protein